MALGPPQPPIQWVQTALALWAKQPGHTADHTTKYGAQSSEKAQ